MEELKKLFEELQKAFHDFKQANDARLKEIEAKGRPDPTLDAKVDKANAEVARLQKALEELQAKTNRKGATAEPGGDEAKGEHRKAFGRFMRKGHEDGLRELEQKALQVAVDADGGYAVPEELDRNIGQIERDATPMESIVNAITAGAETYEKLFNLGGFDSGWVDEDDARTETDTGKLASVTPLYGELYANPHATQKMLDDAMFDVEAWIASEVGLKFAKDLDVAIVSGTGTKQPKGILAYTLAATADATRTFGQIQKIVTATSAVVIADELFDVIYALKPAYRQNGRWVMAGTTLATFRKFKDENKQYLWQPSLQAGQPSTLCGYPVVEDENVPAIAADKNVAMFGDFKRAYTVVNIRGVRVLRDPFTAKPKVGFYTTKRVGGMVEDSLAVKVLTTKA